VGDHFFEKWIKEVFTEVLKGQSVEGLDVDAVIGNMPKLFSP